jgi:hypothetical protein
MLVGRWTDRSGRRAAVAPLQVGSDHQVAGWFDFVGFGRKFVTLASGFEAPNCGSRYITIDENS